MGKFKQIKGEAWFFLYPGEILQTIQDVNILTETDALLLQAIDVFEDEEGVKRNCGDKWMIQGPCRYIPPISVKILEKRNLIPLDKNEGIYIRDKVSG